jgi:hypothetical protein
MEVNAMKFPFELSFAEVQADLDSSVTAVFSCLESEFLVMPKGIGFIDYPVFERGYEALLSRQPEVLPFSTLNLYCKRPSKPL